MVGPADGAKLGIVLKLGAAEGGQVHWFPQHSFASQLSTSIPTQYAPWHVLVWLLQLPSPTPPKTTLSQAV